MPNESYPKYSITKGPKGGCIEIFTHTFSTGTTIIDNSIFMKIFMNIGTIVKTWKEAGGPV